MKIYTGVREAVEPYPPEAKVYMTPTIGGKTDFERLMLHKSLQIRNHSPTGFEWGYGGSGPHQLALALLMDATGDNELAEAHYHDFCVTHVMGWDRNEFSVTDEYINAWVKNRKPSKGNEKT